MFYSCIQVCMRVRLHKYSLPVLIAKCRKKFNKVQYLLYNKDTYNRNMGCLCTVKHRATCIILTSKNKCPRSVSMKQGILSISVTNEKQTRAFLELIFPYLIQLKTSCTVILYVLRCRFFFEYLMYA
jgi:hypothetical protein